MPLPLSSVPSGPQIGRANKVAERLIREKSNNPETPGLTANIEEKATWADFKLAD